MEQKVRNKSQTPWAFILHVFIENQQKIYIHTYTSSSLKYLACLVDVCPPEWTFFHSLNPAFRTFSHHIKILQANHSSSNLIQLKEKTTMFINMQAHPTQNNKRSVYLFTTFMDIGTCKHNAKQATILFWENHISHGEWSKLTIMCQIKVVWYFLLFFVLLLGHICGHSIIENICPHILAL